MWNARYWNIGGKTNFSTDISNTHLGVGDEILKQPKCMLNTGFILMIYLILKKGYMVQTLIFS